MIKEYPKELWHGGMARHIVRDKVILLERGQVFEIEGKRFFTFGGAASHDIQGGILDLDDPEFMVKRQRANQILPSISGEKYFMVGSGTSHRGRDERGKGESGKSRL